MAETNGIPFLMGELQIHLPECLRAQVEQGVLIPIEEEAKEKDALSDMGVTRILFCKEIESTDQFSHFLYFTFNPFTPTTLIHQAHSPLYTPTLTLIFLLHL